MEKCVLLVNTEGLRTVRMLYVDQWRTRRVGSKTCLVRRYFREMGNLFFKSSGYGEECSERERAISKIFWDNSAVIDTGSPRPVCIQTNLTRGEERSKTRYISDFNRHVYLEEEDIWRGIKPDSYSLVLSMMIGNGLLASAVPSLCISSSRVCRLLYRRSICE